MADINVEKLTKDLQAGKGCALQPVLEQLGYQETLKLMTEIVQKTRADHASNPNLPELQIDTGIAGAFTSNPAQLVRLATVNTSNPMFTMSVGLGDRNRAEVMTSCSNRFQKL